MPGGNQPAGQTVATTNSSPWSGVQPYLETGFEQAGQQLDLPNEFYPNSTVVGFSPQTEQSLQSQEQRATQGSPLTQAAQGEVQKTLGGEYLNAGNPAFGAMAERIENQVRPGIDSRFADAGRYGGGGHGEMMARTMADALAPLQFQNYTNERQAMQGAAALAPGLAQQDYFDIGQMRDVGGVREGLARDELAEDIDRWNYGQQEPRDRLAQYMALIKGGNLGSSSTTTQPYYTNTAGNVLGGVGAGVGILGELAGAGKDFGWWS